MNEAADRYVSTTGDDTGNDCSIPASPCATVAHAVDSAVNYDVIKLAQGSYAENIEISTTLNGLDLRGGWNADFSHQSDNPALTILEGDAENPVITIMAQLVNLNVSIEGLDIRKGSSGISALSLGASLELNVSNCIVKDNLMRPFEDPDPVLIVELAASDPVSELSYLGGGITAFSIYTGIVSLSVKDCLNRGNTGFFGGVSVAAMNATLTIEDSVIENNMSGYRAGGVTAAFQGGGNNTATLKRNRIIGNGGAQGGGILIGSEGGKTAAIEPARRDQASQCKPFAAGDMTGGNVDLKVGIPELSEPADIYLALYAPSISDNIFLIGSDHSFQPLSSGLVPWRANTTGNTLESLFGSIPASAFPDGSYFLAVYLTPVGNPGAYYIWATSFTIP